MIDWYNLGQQCTAMFNAIDVLCVTSKSSSEFDYWLLQMGRFNRIHTYCFNRYKKQNDEAINSNFKKPLE